MKKYFSRRVKAVLSIALVLTIALAVVGGVFDLDLPGVIVKGVLTPLRSGLDSMTRQVEQMYDYMFRYEALVAENEELRERIAQMEDNARTADALQRENERFRDLLELTDDREDFQLVDAYVISWDSTDWSSSFTINRGSAYGIREDMCVITANGAVVGLVTEVGANYAVVRTVLDSSLEVSATISASGYNGMVKGGYATGVAGMLRMDYLPSDAILRNGDQVVTSGSTLYPRDLKLGQVVDAGFDASGVAKYAVLEPAADFGSLEQVFVLTQFDTE